MSYDTQDKQNIQNLNTEKAIWHTAEINTDGQDVYKPRLLTTGYSLTDKWTISVRNFHVNVLNKG